MAAAEKDFESFVDKHAAWVVRGSAVVVGLAGAAVFARSLRLFTRFESVRQIPESFVRKQVRLRGSLREVSDDGLLRVRHSPAVRLPLRRDAAGGPLLTVRLAAIRPTAAAAEWMRSSVRADGLVLAPVRRLPDAIDCEVFAKLGRLPFKHNLNRELVRRGLARVPQPDDDEHRLALQTVPSYSRLVGRMLLSEKASRASASGRVEGRVQIADRRGVGMWRRDTWVESVRAYPAQLTQLVANAAWFRLLVLLVETAKTTVVVVFSFAMQVGRVAGELGRFVFEQLSAFLMLIQRVVSYFKR